LSLVRATTSAGQTSLRGPTQSFFTINEILENGTGSPEGSLWASLLKIGVRAVAVPRERPPAAPVHSAAAFPFSRGPAKFFTINEIVGNARSIRLPIEYDEPFGLTAFVQPEGLLWTQWRKVEAATGQEMPILRKCIADQSQCTEAAAQFSAIVFSAGQRTGRARFELVHRLVNYAIRYKSDEEQWGVADLWSSPLSTFATGFGDCEDYVIAKYVALRESGVADKDLRMILGYDKGRRSGHAVLAVRNDGDRFILDHLAPRPLAPTDLLGFVPLFSFNASGVNFLAMPYTPRSHLQIAGAKAQQ
jgi:predicted transglutaminase-like cysteine proteinase